MLPKEVQPLTRFAILTLAASLSLVSCRSGPQLGPGERAQIAEEAFIYGYPMVMAYGIMHAYAIDRNSGQFKAPFNQIWSASNVYTWKDTAVVTPNSDTPYSMLYMDLRTEPIVLSVPEVESTRYYSVQLTDMYTYNYGYIGSRATGNGAGTYMVAGPRWQGEIPAGVDKVFRCETDFSIAIYRTQLFGPADMPNVQKVQAGYKAQPLSAFLGTEPPPAPPLIAWPKMDTQLAETDPFSYLAFVLQFAPTVGPAEVERPLRARFAEIGIEAGKPFRLAELTPEQKNELEEGIKSGLDKIQQRVKNLGATENGWVLSNAFGNRAFYDGDWTLRAAGAMGGIYGNDRVEAMYPLLATRPDASQGNYRLTFAADELPPVKAFWSVTMYDGKTQFLIENPIDRYLINSTMLPQLKKNADGSLTLYLQHSPPGKEWESNWLPAPDGPMYVAMRLYWPEEEALGGDWKPPPLEVVK